MNERSKEKGRVKMWDHLPLGWEDEALLALIDGSQSVAAGNSYGRWDPKNVSYSESWLVGDVIWFTDYPKNQTLTLSTTTAAPASGGGGSPVVGGTTAAPAPGGGGAPAVGGTTAAPAPAGGGTGGGTSSPLSSTTTATVSTGEQCISVQSNYNPDADAPCRIGCYFTYKRADMAALGMNSSGTFAARNSRTDRVGFVIMFGHPPPSGNSSMPGDAYGRWDPKYAWASLTWKPGDELCFTKSGLLPTTTPSTTTAASPSPAFNKSIVVVGTSNPIADDSCKHGCYFNYWKADMARIGLNSSGTFAARNSRTGRQGSVVMWGHLPKGQGGIGAADHVEGDAYGRWQPWGFVSGQTWQPGDVIYFVDYFDPTPRSPSTTAAPTDSGSVAQTTPLPSSECAAVGGQWHIRRDGKFSPAITIDQAGCLLEIVDTHNVLDLRDSPVQGSVNGSAIKASFDHFDTGTLSQGEISWSCEKCNNWSHPCPMVWVTSSKLPGSALLGLASAPGPEHFALASPAATGIWNNLVSAGACADVGGVWHVRTGEGLSPAISITQAGCSLAAADPLGVLCSPHCDRGGNGAVSAASYTPDFHGVAGQGNKVWLGLGLYDSGELRPGGDLLWTCQRCPEWSRPCPMIWVRAAASAPHRRASR